MYLGPYTASLGNDQHRGAREEQQDYFAIDLRADEPRVLLVLADGMGGHADGAIASVLAVDAFVEGFRRPKSPAPEEALRACLDSANAAVLAGASGASSDMGTTLVAVDLGADSFHWLSVGDSVLLSCEGDFVMRLNRDHHESSSDVPPRPGAEAPRPERRRAALTSYLGLDPLPEFDVSGPHPLRADLRLVLASDGLVDALALDEIGPIVARAVDAQGAAEALVRAAIEKARPNQDNVSVVVIALTPCEDRGTEATR